MAMYKQVSAQMTYKFTKVGRKASNNIIIQLLTT